MHEITNLWICSVPEPILNSFRTRTHSNHWRIATALTQLSTQWPIQQHHQPWRTRPRGRREGWPRHASTAGGGSPPDAQRRGERRAACRRRQDPERPGYASARQAAASYPLEERALRAARPRAPACRRLPETRRSAAGAARRRAPSRRPRPPCGTSRAPWRPPGSRYGLLGGRRALRRREWRARASGGKLRGRGAGMGCALPPSSELRCFQLGKKKSRQKRLLWALTHQLRPHMESSPALQHAGRMRDGPERV